MIKLLKVIGIVMVFGGFFSDLKCQDSLKLIPVKAWMLSRLVDETKLGRLCDSTLSATISALQLSTETNSKQSDLLNEVTTSRNLWQTKSSMQDTLLSVRDKIHEKNLKKEKTKVRKLFIVVVAETVLVILILL